MLNKDILNRLKELHLTPMANELESQMEHPEAYQTLSFEDRLSLLIDVQCKTAHCGRRKPQIIFGSSVPADCAVSVPTAV